MKKLILLFLSGLSLLALVSCGKWKEVSRLEKTPGSIYFAGAFDKETVAMIGYSGTVGYFDSENKQWKEGENRTMCLYGFDSVDEKTYVACGNGSGVTMTRDGGKNWTPLTPFGANEPGHCRYASFSSEETGWIASTNKIGQTTDAGQSWNTIPFDDKQYGRIVAMYHKKKDTGYLVTMKGLLVKTEDGGSSWSEVTSLFNPKEIKIHNDLSRSRQTASLRMHEDQGVFAFIDEGDTGYTLNVMNTDDQGVSWTAQEPIPHTLSTVYINPEGTLISTLNMDSSVSLFAKN